MAIETILSSAETRLSLICLSVGRPWTLAWQMSYWSGFPAHLIHVDGTSGLDWRVKSGSDGVFSWDALTLPEHSYMERLDAALERCTTDYVALIDDEEAYFFSGIVRAIELLDSRPEYSCAGGTVADARLSGSNFIIRPWAGRLMDWSKSFCLEAEDPCARVKDMVSELRTGNLYYTVVRTSVLRAIVTNLQQLNLSKTLLGYEIALTSGLALAGRYRMGDYLFWCRMGGSTPQSKLRDELNSEEVMATTRFLVNLDGLLGPRVGSKGPVDVQALEGHLERALREFDRRRRLLPPVQPVLRDDRFLRQLGRARLVGSAAGTEVLVDDERWAADGVEVHDRELMYLAEAALNGIRPPESLVEA